MLFEPNVKVDWWILSGNSWYLILSDRISTTRQEENKENSDDPWEQCGKNVIQVSQWILAVIPERSGRFIDPVDIYDCSLVLLSGEQENFLQYSFPATV